MHRKCLSISGYTKGGNPLSFATEIIIEMKQFNFGQMASHPSNLSKGYDRDENGYDSAIALPLVVCSKRTMTNSLRHVARQQDCGMSVTVSVMSPKCVGWLVARLCA